MVKNKDRWSALSMSERADLIKLYVSNGITSLDAIKKDYNSFDDGGPTREMTPSEAASLNKTLNNSQYMLAVGDSPDDPAYLSTDVLDPAVVKAFNSAEDYNRYQGEKFGEYVSNEISEAGTKLAPVLVGAAAAPWAISGGIAAYTNPITRSIIDLAGSIDGIRNAASKNGIRKTVRLAKEKDYWGAAKSGIGDVFDIAGGLGFVDDAYRYTKGAGKRLAEAVVRIGDRAPSPAFIKTQIFNKNALNYILNPYADPNLAYKLPYQYSGEFKGKTGAHYGDIVDKYFRKVPVNNTLSKTDIPTSLQDYIATNYPKKDVAFVDLGEVDYGPLSVYDMSFLNDGEVIKMGQEAAKIRTVEGRGLDPGGYNYFATRKDEDLIETGFDIWKFNEKDYMNRYHSRSYDFFPQHPKLNKMINKSKLSTIIPKMGLKFIDSMGTPIVHKFTKTTPGYYSTSIFNNGGKLNIFDTGGPIEPLYYDNTPIEPAVVKAFNSNEDYNRYYGEQFGKQIAKKRDEVANSIMPALEYIPFVGDGIDVANTIASINEEDYSKAAVLAGLALLPNALESVGKAVTRPFKNLLGLNPRKAPKNATEKVKALLERFPKGMSSSSHFSASLKERLLKEGVDPKLLTDDNLKKMTYLRSQDILESATPSKFAARESSSGINMYNLYNTTDSGVTQVGYINAVPNPKEKSGRIAMVENVTLGSRKPVKGVSELGYNTVIKDLGASENGRVLLRPESTIPVLDKYKDKDVIGNYGVWYINGSQTLGNPVYRLNTPTYDVPIKYLDDFSVEGLDDSGMFLFDFTKGPLLKNGGKLNKN